jgi:chromatin modification-related protein VID21
MSQKRCRLEANNSVWHRGRPFDDSRLPFPTRDATPLHIKSRPSPLPPLTHAPSPLSPAPDAFSKPDSVERIATPTVQKPSAVQAIATPPVNTQTPPRSPFSAQKDAPPIEVSPVEHQEPRSAPAASPTLTLQVALSSTTSDSANLKEHGVSDARKDEEKHAKVVHLPPKEEQVQHLQEVEKAQETASLRERKEDAAASLSLSLSVPAVDAGSSPSSTAGAASTATPKPTQHSPDTSPDVETSHTHRIDGQHLPTPDAASSELAKSAQPPIREEEPPAISPTPGAQLLQETAEATKAAAPQASSADQMQVDSTKAATPPVKDEILAEQPKVNGALLQSTRPSAVRRSSPFVKSSKETPLPKAAPTEVQDVMMEDRPESPVATPATSRAAVTPRPPAAEPSTQRIGMTTRVASGAMRQKSVSEILGGPPRPAQPERTPSSQALVQSRSGRRDLPPTPSEERSKHSLVVFSKSQDRLRRDLENEPDGYLALKGASLDTNKDYMRPLFINQAYHARAAPLQELVSSAHKVISTANIQATIREQGDYKILRRIYQLQNANKWSLRQMAKFADPRPPITHLDHLLLEMKWMRTDFKEERRWKMAAARNLAEWCALYVAASDEVKQHLRVKTKRPSIETTQPMEIADSFDSTPPLEHSGSTPSDQSLPDDLPLAPQVPSTPPTALFWLGYDDLTFQIDPTPAAEGVLNELPQYQPKVPPSAPIEPKSLIPVSRFAAGKLVPTPSSAPKKRSRYQYEEEESDSSSTTASRRRNSDISLFMSPSRRSPRYKELSPEETDVALFNPVNRHIRERLHAAHAFRPPSEFLMPSTLFFECRQPSQWTWEEDQKLRKSVKEYSYNWSIISMEMTKFTQPSKLVSGIERRTPWECFERWVQLEGLPNDMGKTQYFRTYSQRLEAANKAVQAQRAQQQAQQQVQTPNQGPQARLKGTSPFRVERRRDGRYIGMIDAIRKIVRKRESQAHRQQEGKCPFKGHLVCMLTKTAAKAAALRKQQANTDNNQQRPSGIHTPAEFSRMKYEREQKMHERQEAYRRQMLEQQQKVWAPLVSDRRLMANRFYQERTAPTTFRADGPTAGHGESCGATTTEWYTQ